eukprot:scaffold22485_cov70-Phaeocystis_antarctica.AAC.1
MESIQKKFDAQSKMDEKLDRILSTGINVTFRNQSGNSAGSVKKRCVTGDNPLSLSSYHWFTLFVLQIRTSFGRLAADRCLVLQLNQKRKKWRVRRRSLFLMPVLNCIRDPTACVLGSLGVTSFPTWRSCV